jgi:hypothetical protein
MLPGSLENAPGSTTPNQRWRRDDPWRQLNHAESLNVVWRLNSKRAIPLQLSIWGDGDGSP